MASLCSQHSTPVAMYYFVIWQFQAVIVMALAVWIVTASTVLSLLSCFVSYPMSEGLCLCLVLWKLKVSLFHISKKLVKCIAFTFTYFVLFLFWPKYVVHIFLANMKLPSLCWSSKLIDNFCPYYWKLMSCPFGILNNFSCICLIYFQFLFLW